LAECGQINLAHAETKVQIEMSYGESKGYVSDDVT